MPSFADDNDRVPGTFLFWKAMEKLRNESYLPDNLHIELVSASLALVPGHNLHHPAPPGLLAGMCWRVGGRICR